MPQPCEGSQGRRWRRGPWLMRLIITRCSTAHRSAALTTSPKGLQRIDIRRSLARVAREQAMPVRISLSRSRPFLLKCFLMHLAQSRRSVACGLRLGRILAVAVFLGLAGTTGRAEANCGDWLAGHEAGAVRAAAYDSAVTPSNRPCYGPHCRRPQEPRPEAPVAPVRHLDGPERWCDRIERVVVAPPQIGSLAHRPVMRPTEGIASRIDRPPQG